ncbi:MAG: hypothetical protein JWN75_1220 [Candidatus Saccharibacteria bacterium]|nr:hypothetical protein [Candidatus Saccharibacteria bacterium]MDB5716417.1 hypothetical protein [Sphingomonadales bacterium]
MSNDNDGFEADKANLIKAALAAGFEELSDGRLICTKDQLILLLALVADEALKQASAEGLRQINDGINDAAKGK